MQTQGMSLDTAAADNRIILYKQQISTLEAGESQGKYPKHSSWIAHIN